MHYETTEKEMNELIGHSANMMLAETENGRLTATVELVLLVSEPKYQSDPSGFVKTRSIADVRFATSQKGLRALARELEELANDAAELEERASLKARPAT
jgi:hypothetical protein